MNILMLDCTSTPYNGETLDRGAVGGIELVTRHLAEELTRRGCVVTVRNQTPETIRHAGVLWENSAQPGNGSHPDIILANNDVTLFDAHAAAISAGAQPVLWLHNACTWKRLIGKKRVHAQLRWRPTAIFLSHHQMRHCSPLIPFRQRTVIPHAVAIPFFEAGDNPAPALRRQAVFLSQSYRGLKDVVEGWITHVRPGAPDAVLKAFVGRSEAAILPWSAGDLATAGVEILDRLPQAALREEVLRSRFVACPGHPDETFCNVAAEATVMGVPVVTRGIGSLCERVQDGVNGFCRPDKAGFASAMLALFDDETSRALRAGALSVREAYRWETRTAEWLALFSALKTA